MSIFCCYFAVGTVTVENIPYISASLDGVVIDGIRWATRNVDAPGTFAAAPEDFGMFYQWNRPTAWEWGVNHFGNFDLIPASGTEWERANDPCPDGWRVPTNTEIQSLINAGSGWTSYNGVNGRIFGSGANRIFLPFAGWLQAGGGATNLGISALYWSNTPVAGNGLAFSFGTGFTNMVNALRANGASVRCVEDTPPTRTRSAISMEVIEFQGDVVIEFQGDVVIE